MDVEQRKTLYNAPGHTPVLAYGARELRFPQSKKAQFVTVKGILRLKEAVTPTFSWVEESIKLLPLKADLK